MKKIVIVLLAVAICLTPVAMGVAYARAGTPVLLADNPKPPPQPSQDPDDPPPPPFDPSGDETDGPPPVTEEPPPQSDFLSEYWWVILVAVLGLALIILIVMLSQKGKKQGQAAPAAAPYAAAPPPQAPPPQAAPYAATPPPPPPAPTYPATPPAPAYTTPLVTGPMVASHGGSQLICTKGHFAGANFPLGTSLSFGRDPRRCQIVFPANTSGISSLHCELSALPAGLMLTDKGSSYGTFLAGGRKLNPHQGVMLQPGDSFYLASPENEFRVL
ncbi:MAG: FHA domain-containing protein [Oscillospiraceae bacterium]|nr:FHA domain-containing protein [Oscillospiraceae bacterium]